MKTLYHTWHTNEVTGLNNWIYNLDKTKDAAKVEILRNIVQRMCVRRIMKECE